MRQLLVVFDKGGVSLITLLTGNFIIKKSLTAFLSLDGLVPSFFFFLVSCYISSKWNKLINIREFLPGICFFSLKKKSLNFH